MNLIQIYRAIISEAKQVGTLYHVTSIGRGLRIFQTNTMMGTIERQLKNSPWTISMTRDKNFIYDAYGGMINKMGYIQFVINGNKLSTRYKIRPFDYYRNHFTDFIGSDISHYDEKEEIILTKKINNFTRYIEKIRYKQPKIEKYKKVGDSYIQQIKEICDPLGIEIEYVK